MTVAASISSIARRTINLACDVVSCLSFEEVFIVVVKLFIGSKVQCEFRLGICTPEGMGEKREGMQISK